jgi:hypothetical protein
MRPGGKIEVQGFVQGPQTKGESQIEAGQTLEASREEATDALSKQRIPRDYSKHAKEYFEQVGGSK